MATRPWVTPQEITSYTASKEVKARSSVQLVIDIARAEQYVATYCHNDFSGDDEALPASVKTAVIILADAYAHNAEIASKDVKSETFDDYSYTAESSGISIESLDLAALLDPYVQVKATNTVTMRMRRL